VLEHKSILLSDDTAELGVVVECSEPKLRDGLGAGFDGGETWKIGIVLLGHCLALLDLLGCRCTGASDDLPSAFVERTLKLGELDKLRLARS
jgi:hypothetical protein